MRLSRVVLGLVVALIIVAGLLAACGGATPEPVQPTEELEPTEAPTEAPAEEPTEAPAEEPTEAPAEEPTEAPAEEPASIDAEALLQERCNECHGLDRTTSARKSREEWEQTVTRMVNRGAELNEDEQAILIDYLAATYGP